MVQRKEPSTFIQADHVKSDKRLAKLKLSTQQQDGKGSGGDINKSRSILLSDLEASPSSPSKRSISRPTKPPPLHVLATATTPQKQQPLMRTGRSTHYMKPTSSSDAKNKLSPASLQYTQTDSDYKNQLPKISSNWKASPVPGKQPATSLTKSSSKLVITLTKNPSFKHSRACRRKSPRVALCADMNAQRATCSSTLKNSLFPACLMLNPGVTESDGISFMKVCPYAFCSLNGYQHTPLPLLKSFLSARRRILKMQKTMKQGPQSLLRLKAPFQTKDSDTEQIVIDKPACDDAETDFFIEIYAKLKEDEAKLTAAGHGEKMRKLESSEVLQDQNVIESTTEDNSMAAGEDNIKQVTTRMSNESHASNFKEEFKKYSDAVVTEADFLQEPNTEAAHEDHPPSCSHEVASMESYCSEISNKQLKSSEMDAFNSEANDAKRKEEQVCTSKHEEEVVSAFLTKEKTKLKVESSSEFSLEVSAKLDNIFGSCDNHIPVEELQEANAQECSHLEPQPHGTVLDLSRIMSNQGGSTCESQTFRL